ncbi:HD domain-containing protein [Bacillus sp. NTK034]|uniref:HD domain-containing protein n=1 Tax=Bacillus sp. NTK034 TaxID=2802176 RepID=UPI001A8EC5C7|nr:HD domain-containing protein [Bacillus sp. NTK034]MBN8203358.1 HD domain-containing protein [Bacillus sp. NTK034]
MLAVDELYGEYKLERVLEEIINSRPVQRLKGVHQGGAGYLVNEKWNVTRYEHSLGVMLLLRKMGGSVEEQIAGLLHDVSHTAFSHVIDGVLENEAEDYHEHIFERVVLESEIPAILKRHHLDFEGILFDDSQWTLLEQPAPELCADRVDYTLRDMYRYGYISLEEAHHFLQHLTVVDGRMYLSEIGAAEWFVKTYYKEVIDFFMEPLNIYANDFFAKVLKRSLEKKLLHLDDLLGNDEEVLVKMRESGDLEVKRLLEKIDHKVRAEENRSDYDIHFKGKMRLIDPSVMINSKLVRASQLSEEVINRGQKAYEKAKEGVYIKVL